MKSFCGVLYFFGPLTAVSYFINGLLLPGALIVAAYSVAGTRSRRNIAILSAICLAITILVTHQAARHSIIEFAAFFTATALPFAIQAMLFWGCFRIVGQFDRWLNTKATNAPNP